MADLDSTTLARPVAAPRDALDLDATAQAGLDATTAPRLDVTRDSPVDGDAPLDLPRGALIGRYVVLDRIGAGAMGVVFAAIDPELDRKVAIKLLQPGLGGHSLSATSDARARLVREAQALAKLSHPNVVAIFDVGTRDDQVWIAMEFVAGRTLRSWFAEAARDWQEILAVMEAAGRGLAAAHAAGLVHRDIKPDNVMIADDGRVRVMDFGLARHGGRSEPRTDPVLGQTMLSINVTHAGALVGTPAYMPPEQIHGQHVGPPADVFAFCVMLWEGLHGARPFAGTTVSALCDAIDAGAIVRPSKRRAPRWLEAIVLRGLAAAPARRWPDMQALLAELERARARTRRHRVLALAGGLAAVAGGVYGGSAALHERTVAACERAGAAIDDDWSEAARAGLERAFTAIDVPHAATVLAKTTPWFDRWTSAWRAARTQVCLEHDVARDLDDELHVRAQDCLDEQRGTFVALLGELGHADASTLTRATSAAAGLPAPSACTDLATLRQRPPPSLEDRAEVMAIRRELARASSLHSAGKFSAALEAARPIAAAARRWPALLAEAEFDIGYFESQLAAFPAAERSLQRALAAARAARSPRIATKSMTLLAYVVGDGAARFAEGKVWAEAARTELTHVAGDTRTLEAQLDLNLAQVHLGEGNFDEALRLNERALATWTEVWGEAHPQVAQSLNNLGNVYSRRGAAAEALPRYEKALALREQTLGADHPYVAGSLNNVGLALLDLGRPAEARQAHERALALRERILDAEHPDVVESLINLGNVHFAVGAHAEALATYQRALAALERSPTADPRAEATLHYNCGLIHGEQCRDADAIRDHARALELFERVLGPRHPTLAAPLDGLGIARRRLGELDESLQLHERGRQLRVAAFGEDNPAVMWSMYHISAVHRERGRLAEALRYAERALAIVEAAYGERHFHVAPALANLAEVQLAAGRPAEALPAIERALGLLEPDDTSPERRPWLEFLRARALWDARVDRPRAHALASQSAATIAAAGGCDRVLGEIRAWLAAHPQ